MADEDFIVRFYFDTREAERDAAKMANRLATISAALKDMGVNTKYVDQAATSMAKMGNVTQTETAKAEKGVRGFLGAMGDLRSVGYEALVVGGIFNRFGVQVTDALAGVVGTAIDYERAFANVIRTTNDGTIGMSALRQELIALTTEIPITFQELTKIATLGGQLGIAGSGIDEFTSVVARLAATTDLTAEAAGTALGRFQALLGVPSEEFENLASAILQVGVNSVATETQIVAISTQISSMADFAGLTAEQIVGLAGALASVGAQPELSRGTITRTFSLISKAVSAGGDDLEEFARISGVSAEQFSSAFGTERFAPIFQSFLKNLGQMQQNGDNVVVTLNELGISSVRDVPLLLRLAGATDTVTEAFQNSKEGYRDATTLQEQYGIIAQTTASRIQILVNNLTNFLAVIGGSATGPISAFVDMLSEVVKGLTDFAATDVGQGISIVALALTALIGVIAVLAGGVTFAAGTLLLLGNALTSVTTSGLLSTGAVSGLNVAMGLAGRTAAIFGAALRAIPFAIAVAGFAALQTAISDFATTQYGFDNLDQAFAGTLDADKLIHRIEQAGDALAGLQNGLNRNLGIDEFGRALKATDEGLAALANSGNIGLVQSRIQTMMVITGKSFDEVLTAFPDTQKALANLATQAGVTESSFLNAAEAEAEFAALQERTAAALGLTSDEFTDLQTNLTKGSSGFVNFGDLIQRVQDQTRGFAEDASKDAYGAIDSWQEFYDGSSVNIYAFMDLLDQQIAAQDVWADDLAELSARGASAFVSELAKMGPEGAPLAAAAVNLTAEELFRLEEQARLAAFLASDAFAQEFTANTPKLIEAYRTGGIEAVRALIAAGVETAPQAGPALTAALQASINSQRPLTFRTDIDTTGALAGLNSFVTNNQGRTIAVNVAGTRNFAGGGRVYGPGSGTSDSIPARLSNGEYVVRAASVRRYGTGLFDSLNRGVARFAGGGQVGTASTGGGGFGGVVELGPRSMGVLREIVSKEMSVALTPLGVARLANQGNKQISNQGGQR